MAQPNMDAVSDEHDARTRKALTLVLKRAQTATNQRIASKIGIDAGQLSRWREEHLERAIEFILASGCKVVPRELVCYDEKYIDTVEYLADIGFKHARESARRISADGGE